MKTAKLFMLVIAAITWALNSTPVKSHAPAVTPAPGIVADFLARAPEAEWTNAYERLPFPGDPSDERGFARLIENAQLEDGKVYNPVLQTHPQWQRHGIIVGRYRGVTLPEDGAEFRAGIGFLEGATASDGVYFEVRAEFPGYSGIPVRREYHKPYKNYVIRDFVQDLSRFRGKKGTIVLSVDAGGKSSAQDWAVWVKPQLVSMESEYKFATFVGGAVGSGRSGNRLLNAWGGQSEQLYGNITLYLLFANLDSVFPVEIQSYHEDQFMGTTKLGTVKPGRSELWKTFSRTLQGLWREQVIFNGTYVGDLRYNISKVGE